MKLTGHLTHSSHNSPVSQSNVKSERPLLSNCTKKGLLAPKTCRCPLCHLNGFLNFQLRNNARRQTGASVCSTYGDPTGWLAGCLLDRVSHSGSIHSLSGSTFYTQFAVKLDFSGGRYAASGGCLWAATEEWVMVERMSGWMDGWMDEWTVEGV